MNIQGPSGIHGIQSVKGPHSSHRTAGAKSSPSTSHASDKVEISSAGEAASLAAESGDIRADLVARVRGEIANGSYDTPDKMEAALDGLLNELG